MKWHGICASLYMHMYINVSCERGEERKGTREDTTNQISKILQFATALVPTHTQSLVLRITLMISSVQLIKKSGMACRCSCGKKKQVIRVN